MSRVWFLDKCGVDERAQKIYVLKFAKSKMKNDRIVLLTPEYNVAVKFLCSFLNTSTHQHISNEHEVVAQVRVCNTEEVNTENSGYGVLELQAACKNIVIVGAGPVR